MNSLDTTIKNLIILRDNWEKLDQKPKMTRFGGITDLEGDIEVGITHSCGTNCCALGKAPEFVGLEIQKTDFNEDLDKEFLYTRYSDRLFPHLVIGSGDTWKYLFGSHNPNNKAEFLKRLNKVITKYQIDNEKNTSLA